MAIDRTPWFVGGGAEHSPEVARMLLYVSTGGAEGIVEPASLRVQAMPTAGKTVRVAPGGGIMVSRYAGAVQQSYGARNVTQTEVSITATGSGSGRTDVVALRILDPQYEGQAPADPNNFDYSRLVVIQGAPAATKSARDLNLTYPAIALAKIAIPANTATITNAMITDLREVANPRRSEVLRARPAVASETETLTVTADIGEWFPNAGAEQSIHIPEWATRAIIEATWIQVREPGGNSAGQCWVEFGPWAEAGRRQYSTQRFQWNTHSGNDVARSVWEVADDRVLTADIRGTDQVFVMKARVTSTTAGSARPQVDGESGVKLRVTFLESADKSTT